MEDFKSNTKMQCFKEGGQVKYETRKEHKEEMKSDMSQDKSMVKKGVRQHEVALHKGQPKTELKLKAGGRAKKAAGTVKKFDKASGQYGAKKTDGDIKRIKDAKNFKPKKMQMGGLSGMTGPAPAGSAANAQSGAMGQGQITELEKRRQMEKMARAKKYLGPAQQGELISQDPRAAGLTGNIGYKKGGKVKKYADGGYVPVSEKKVVDNMFKSAPSKTPAAAPSAAVKLSPEAQKFDLNKTVKEAIYKKRGGKAC
jgi:hypothetical protein